MTSVTGRDTCHPVYFSFVSLPDRDWRNEYTFWTKILREQPQNYDAHNNLGAVYCQQGLWDMALYEFMKAVRFDPKNASAHKNIGMIYFAKGDKQRAKEHLSQIRNE